MSWPPLRGHAGSASTSAATVPPAGSGSSGSSVAGSSAAILTQRRPDLHSTFAITISTLLLTHIRTHHPLPLPPPPHLNFPHHPHLHSFRVLLHEVQHAATELAFLLPPGSDQYTQVLSLLHSYGGAWDLARGVGLRGGTERFELPAREYGVGVGARERKNEWRVKEAFAGMDPREVPLWITRAVGGGEAPGALTWCPRVGMSGVPRQQLQQQQQDQLPPMVAAAAPPAAGAAAGTGAGGAAIELAAASRKVLNVESRGAWAVLEAMITQCVVVSRGEDLAPPSTHGRNPRVDAIYANLLAEHPGPQGPFSEDPKKLFLDALLNGERWEVLAGGVGPGVILLIAMAAGGLSGLALWKTKEVGWGGVEGAVMWVMEARPELVAWCRTFGAVLVRGCMGVFEAPGGVGVEVVREREEWGRRMVGLCNWCPRRGEAVVGVGGLPEEGGGE